jgi:hypothetical protein
MRQSLLTLAVIALLALGASCQPATGGLAGKYRASDPKGTGAAVLLELRSDGKGSWKMGRDDFSFTWEERGTEVWLHSKSGGVVAGNIDKDRSIHLSLPEVGSFHFEKTGP